MKDCAPEKVGSSAPPFSAPVKALSIVPGSLNASSSRSSNVGMPSPKTTIPQKRQCRRKRRHSQTPVPVKARVSLALRELEASAGFLLAVLFPLDDTRVAGEEALALQRRPQIRLVIGERLGEAVTHRPRLAGEPAAGDRDGEIVLPMALRDCERLLQDHAQHGPGKIDLDGLRVDDDLARTRPDPDAGDRVLALARGISAALLVELLHVTRRLGRGRSVGRLQVLKGGKSFGHGNQALRLFLRFKAARSRTRG